MDYVRAVVRGICGRAKELGRIYYLLLLYCTVRSVEALPVHLTGEASVPIGGRKRSPIVVDTSMAFALLVLLESFNYVNLMLSQIFLSSFMPIKMYTRAPL